MMPATVRFTGLDLDPMGTLNGREKKGPIPSSWLRIRFESDQGGNINKINKWLSANISGQWASYLVPLRFGVRVVIIAFESDTDAVMFRLKSGETAWATDTKDHI